MIFFIYTKHEKKKYHRNQANRAKLYTHSYRWCLLKLYFFAVRLKIKPYTLHIFFIFYPLDSEFVVAVVYTTFVYNYLCVIISHLPIENRIPFSAYV